MSAASAKTQDPSMEEILASIRRIIADDGEAVKAEPRGPGGANGRDPEPAEDSGDHGDVEEDEVLDLADLPEARAPRPDRPESGGPEAGGHDAAPPDAEREPPKPVDSPLTEAGPASLAGLEIERPDLSFQGVAPVAAAPPAASPEPPAAPPAPEPRREEPRAGGEPLISSETTASVGQAFNLLSHSVLARNSLTLEDLVKDMLKPMLKDWLDDNLPPLVERLVRAEIERVARGHH